MAEVPEEEMGTDPDLLDEEDVEQTPTSKPKPAKKRRKKKSGGQDDVPRTAQPPRRRAFVESQVKTSLAQGDMMEVMNRYDWESGDYDVSVLRVQPQNWHGRNIQGYIASFPHSIDEAFIREHFGGGVYDLKIRGPNPRAGTSKGFLDGTRVKISGEPIVSAMDKHLAFDDGGIMLSNPQGGPPSQAQIREAQMARRGGRRAQAAWEDEEGGGRGNGEDPEMVRMSFDRLGKLADSASEEAKQLRERLIDEATRKVGGEGLSSEALLMIKESADRAIESERAAAERLRKTEQQHRQDFERMIAKVSNQNHGIPPEMLASLTEQHRSEINALNESRLTQLTQLQDRHEQEVNALRERYEREITNLQERNRDEVDRVRSELQGRLDREQEQFKREMERERDNNRKEVERLKEEADRRYNDAETQAKQRYEKLNDDWQRRFDQEQDRARAALDQAQERARTERDTADRNNQMQLDHMKSLHETQVTQLTGSLGNQVEQERTRGEAAIASLKAQHEAAISQLNTQLDMSVKLQETSYKAQIDSLQQELARARADLDATKQKVADQGDLVTQAQKLKTVGESLSGVLGLGGASVGAGALSADVDLEPKQEEPKTWWGKVMQFSESNVGESVFEFLKNMAAGAAGMHPGAPMPGMMPGLPGQVQPSYGPPPGAVYGMPHQPAPGPSYGPPPQPTYSPPPQAQPYSHQVMVDEEEYEEEVMEPGGGVVTGSFVDDEVEEAGPGPEPAPQIRSQVDSEGVVRATVPPATSSYSMGTSPESKSPQITPEEMERIHSPSTPESPRSAPAAPAAQPQPVVSPAQPQQPPISTEKIPPDVAEQMKAMISGLEESMTNGVPPNVLAGTIMQVAPPEQLRPFAQTPIQQLVADIQQVIPESMLASYQGRKYLSALQVELSKLIG